MNQAKFNKAAYIIEAMTHNIKKSIVETSPMIKDIYQKGVKDNIKTLAELIAEEPVPAFYAVFYKSLGYIDTESWHHYGSNYDTIDEAQLDYEYLIKNPINTHVQIVKCITDTLSVKEVEQEEDETPF